MVCLVIKTIFQPVISLDALLVVYSCKFAILSQGWAFGSGRLSGQSESGSVFEPARFQADFSAELLENSFEVDNDDFFQIETYTLLL